MWLYSLSLLFAEQVHGGVVVLLNTPTLNLCRNPPANTCQFVLAHRFSGSMGSDFIKGYVEECTTH